MTDAWDSHPRDFVSIESLINVSDQAMVDLEKLQSRQHVAIKDILSTIPERESIILQLRFGILGNQPLTLEIVGKFFGVTRERIRQLEKKALSRLKNPRRLRKLRSLLEGDTKG